MAEPRPHPGHPCRQPGPAASARRIPASLIEAGQTYDKAAYEACLKTSIEEVVRQQVEAGVDIVSDGEFSKGRNWAFYIHDRISGIGTREATPEEMKDPLSSAGGGQDMRAFPEFYAEYNRASGLGKRLGNRFVVNGPLTYNDATVKRDIATLKAAAAKANASARSCRLWRRRARCRAPRTSITPTRRALLFALADCLHQEYQAIVDAGLYVQVDDAFLPYMHERMVPPMSETAVPRLGAASHRRAQSCAARHPAGALALSHLLGQLERPARLRRAAERHRRPAAAGQRRTLQRRAGQPAPRARMDGVANVKLPPGKKLIPGVISHATNIVEHPELVAQRLVRLAKIVGRENVMAGTDCGFAQSPFAKRVHPKASCGRSCGR